MDIDYFSNRKTLDSQNINIRTKLVTLFKLNLPVLRLASQTEYRALIKANTAHSPQTRVALPLAFSLTYIARLFSMPAFFSI